MSVVTIGRLALGPPGNYMSEPVGDPVGSQGSGIVAAARSPQQVTFDLNTILSGASSLANAQTTRRQLRSMMNNTPLKMQAFLYLVYADDTEQNGWLVPQPANITSPDNTAWKAVGLWQIVGAQWYLAGRKRALREARSVWMKDYRTGLYERDALRMILSSDFSALPALPLTVLPHGATQPENAVNGQIVPRVSLPAGRDGGVCSLVYGPQQATTAGTNLINPDLATLGFERPESALNLSDVIVYDRRGQITAPSTGPDTSWEEVYGSDYPWNWLTAGQPADTPVLDNGLVRVRYDSTNTPGFRVDVWNGTAYVEQGKMIVARGAAGTSTVFDDTWVSASLVEWTPDRAVMNVMMSASGDSYSLERVFITVQRGEIGVTFEVYPALTSASTQSDAQLRWAPALNAGAADLNDTLVKIDSQGSGSWTPGAAGTAAIAASAGTGAGSGNSGQWPTGNNWVGATSFTNSENWVALLRYPTVYNTITPYQVSFAVQQAANASAMYVGSRTEAYGVAQNNVVISSGNAAGYLQCQVSFASSQAQQVLEAEGMTLGAGTSSTADAAASGGNAATTTRTTDANAHVTSANWPNSFLGTYRVFARVKTSTGTASFYAKTGSTTGTTVTTTSTSYVWVDLGEITANNTTFEIHAWNSVAGTVSVDRIEAVLTQDQLRTAAIYSGSRDQGQAALYDSRTFGALVAR